MIYITIFAVVCACGFSLVSWVNAGNSADHNAEFIFSGLALLASLVALGALLYTHLT